MTDINIEPKMQNNRPKIELQKTAFNYAIEIASLVILVVTWIYVFLSYSELDSEIPVHFNTSGEADRYGDKQSIFLLPILSVVFFFGLSILNKFPHIFNYPTEITEENAEKQYKNATNLIRTLNLLIVFIFAFITFNMINAKTENSAVLGEWFIPSIIIIINLPGLYFLTKAFKKK
ncbi:DUF1648 domain-containing protein [Marivirga sp.]|uniref:DUF1648 domain-containing protein n=1 Tax=Marivirga sp. TaxID=2018662 RepID=UPI002D7F7482|nr:DUF1648 domain-containing protein [Marivirga sp.]HET8861565.1 DUF1648 domain-containing protein [Marivirga sp.]